MAFTFVVNGVDVTDRIQVENLQTLTTLADHGEVGNSGIILDDPDGDLDLTGWQEAYAEESDCSQPRIWTGFVGGRDIERGQAGNRTAASRIHNATCLDLNALAGWKPLLMDAANKRPAESETARMAWLLTTRAMSGLIYDEGLIDTTGGQSFDEADFRKNYAGEVLASMASTANNWYVYRDHTSGHAALFWDEPDDPVRSSTLKISNVLADVDDDVVWRPYRDARLTRDPSSVYSEVLLAYQGDQWVYERDATTSSAYFGGLDRGYIYESSRIGREATAEDNALRFLDLHAIEDDTITTSVMLPASRVGLIEAGMRMQVKFTHLPGYESYVWMRVVGVDVHFVPGGNVDWYQVQLSLTMRHPLLGQGGGGGGGGVDKTPFVPCPPAAVGIVQTHSQEMLTWQAGVPGHTSFDFDSPPLAGNTVCVIIGEFENDAPVSVPAGWTEQATYAQKNNPAEGRIMIYTFVSDGTQYISPSDGLDWVSGNTLRYTMWELTGVADTPFALTRVSHSLTTTASLSASTPSGDWIGLYGFGVNSSFSQASWTVTSPYTLDMLTTKATEPRMTWAHTTGSGSGTTTCAVTITLNLYIGGFLVVFEPGGSSSDPGCRPAPGQEVPWAAADTVTPGSTTTTVTTQFPYAPESLEVKVDGVLVDPSHIDESDPTTGEFILDWVIDTTGTYPETITVHYLGA